MRKGSGIWGMEIDIGMDDQDTAQDSGDCGRGSVRGRGTGTDAATSCSTPALALAARALAGAGTGLGGGTALWAAMDSFSLMTKEVSLGGRAVL